MKVVFSSPVYKSRSLKAYFEKYHNRITETLGFFLKKYSHPAPRVSRPRPLGPGPAPALRWVGLLGSPTHSCWAAGRGLGTPLTKSAQERRGGGACVKILLLRIATEIPSSSRGFCSQTGKSVPQLSSLLTFYSLCQGGVFQKGRGRPAHRPREKHQAAYPPVGLWFRKQPDTAECAARRLRKEEVCVSWGSEFTKSGAAAL